jgi:hypothetical protein
MALISDVVSGGVVEPSWGNAIRSQGVQTTTSGARPSPASEGMLIYETDSDRFMVYDGSSWVRVGNSTTSGRTGCTIRKTGNTSVGNVANATITWTAEDVDTDGFIAVSSSTVTIPTGLGGLYAVSCSVLFDMATVGTIGVGIQATLSGTIRGYHGSVLAANNTITSSGTIRTSGTSAVIPMSAGDTLVFSCTQSTGGSANLTGAIAHIYRLGV